MQNGLISIVLLNWNGERHVHRCLEHVVAQTYKNLEVIVVDNGSSDGSIEKIEKKYPDFKYIKNRCNRGFAAGMNQGIALSKGAYVVPLNQDVCLHPDFVHACVERIAQDETIGAIGARVYAWIGDELTDTLRAGDGGLFFLRKRFQGLAGIPSDTEAFVFASTGSFPFLRRAMLDDIQAVSGYYFDEQFVNGWEDMDLFFRMHLRGWRCLFLPTASGWHVGSGSVGGKSTFLSKTIDYQVLVLRNRYYTMIKNLPRDTWLWLFPAILVTEMAIPGYFLVRSPRSIMALALAWRQIICQLPGLLEKRGRIQNNIRVPKGYLKPFFKAF